MLWLYVTSLVFMYIRVHNVYIPIWSKWSNSRTLDKSTVYKGLASNRENLFTNTICKSMTSNKLLKCDRYVKKTGGCFYSNIYELIHPINRCIGRVGDFQLERVCWTYIFQDQAVLLLFLMKFDVSYVSDLVIEQVPVGLLIGCADCWCIGTCVPFT